MTSEVLINSDMLGYYFVWNAWYCTHTNLLICLHSFSCQEVSQRQGCVPHFCFSSSLADCVCSVKDMLDKQMGEGVLKGWQWDKEWPCDKEWSGSWHGGQSKLESRVDSHLVDKMRKKQRFMGWERTSLELKSWELQSKNFGKKKETSCKWQCSLLL